MKYDFQIVYEPKPELGYPSRRFFVSPNQLIKYIGFSNADTVILTALKLQVDNLRVKFRKFGIIDIYLK